MKKPHRPMKEAQSPEAPEAGVAAPAPETARPAARGGLARLVESVERAHGALLATQHQDGHWRFEFEADCTIPAEYVLMMHFLDEIDAPLQAKLANYIRAHQGDDGGWPLYYGGDCNLSGTVKAYWALKLSGDSPSAPHMQRARSAILARGGAARCNVFTRFAMALFGHVPWRAVPFLPVELILLPHWLPFHIGRVSYWSRTVVVPLSILYSLRARAANPTGIGIEELFARPAERERDYFPVRSAMNRLFLASERTLRLLEPMIPRFVRRRALARAKQWFVERLNGTDGLGGIFPAMVNAHEALAVLGHGREDPMRTQARTALRKLLVVSEDSAYCQPCLSPICSPRERPRLRQRRRKRPSR